MAVADNLRWFGLIGLASTGLAAFVNLATFTLSAFWLDISALVHLRLALNTALITGILLCLGWDSACVRLQASQIDQLDIFAFWGLSSVACLTMVVSHIAPLSAQAYLHGLALGALFAFPIVHFNIRRAHGFYLSYFIGLNIKDKFVRAVVILAAVYWQPDHMISFIFLGLMIWSIILITPNNRLFSPNFRLGIHFLRAPNKYGNGLFLLSSLFMLYMTRSLFFAIPADNAKAKVTVDLAMIVGAFLFVPVHSVLKISEAEQYRAGEPIFYRTSIQTLRRLMIVEALVLIAGSVLVAVYGRLILPDQIIDWLAFIVFAGFVIASTMPNIVQIAIHAEDSLWRTELVTFIFLSLVTYLIGYWFAHGFILAFGVSVLGYLLFCARLATRLEISEVFKQRLERTVLFLVMQLSTVVAWL